MPPQLLAIELNKPFQRLSVALLNSYNSKRAFRKSTDYGPILGLSSYQLGSCWLYI